MENAYFVGKTLKFSLFSWIVILLNIAKSNAQNPHLNAVFENGTGESFTNWTDSGRRFGEVFLQLLMI